MARLRFGRRPHFHSRRLVGALLSVAVLLIGLSLIPATSSWTSALRDGAGTVLGPAEALVHAATQPVRKLSEYTESNSQLRDDVARLSSQNAQLQRDADQADLDRARLVEFEGLNKMTNQTGLRLIPARVVAMGPVQSFSRTVSLDIGSRQGIGKDMTVVNKDGLVGRVIAVSDSSSTVLLIVDTNSVVGGRLGSNNEIGFLRGRGSFNDSGRLDLDMLDDSVTPSIDDLVVTWGSNGKGPYVAGVPIGKVESVYATPGQLGKHAVIKPLADFSALDVVGVVVPKAGSVR